VTPYAQAALDYYRAGWSPIPLPFREKSPPPDGYTGAGGTYVTEEEIKDWTRKSRPARCRAGNLSFAAGNIALRLPRDIIGIDADMYGSKTGLATMTKAEKDWGALPPTWTSTSRTDGSGISLFKIPTGLAWPGQVGPGVETLRWDHRFAVVAPSIHPDTKVAYRWISPDGRTVTDEIPGFDEIPELPAKWVEGLTGGKSWTDRPADEEMDQDDVRAWLNARKLSTCSVMSTTVQKTLNAIRKAGDDGGAHEMARDGAWGVIGDAAAGHGGVVEALGKLRKVFLSNVSARREKGAAEKEWARIVVRGVQKVAAEGEATEEDMCEAFDNGAGLGTPTSTSPRQPGKGSSAFDYVRDDIGNAQRLLARVGSDARYVPGLGGWAVYQSSTGLWSIDDTGAAIMREAYATVRAMEAEAAFIEDPKIQNAFLAFVRASGNLGKINSMIEAASAMRGVHADAAVFDADPTILVCPNGVIELGPAGAKFRPTRHADYATLSTGTPYEKDARYAGWEEFLGRVLPDKGDRRWVQTLAGYSLFGANPQRILVIAKGPTTSGKTTFANALQSAIGRYAGPFNLSLLRSKQDEGARADIVNALPRRLIVAAEASAEWYLHADTIKLFTGGEPVAARRLNSNIYLERVPAFTPWLMTNSYPQIPGADKALWRRLKAAPFLVGIPEHEIDYTLGDRFRSPEGRAAILAWAVRGWDAYCEDGLREVTPAAAGIELEAREEMSDLDACLAATCVFGAEHTEPAIDLYAIYRAWMEENGDPRHILSLTAWGRAMSAKGFEKVRRRREATDTNKVWYRYGLELNPQWSRRR